MTTQQQNLHEFTVSELSAAIKRAVEDQFPFVRVRGEISGLRAYPSGHVYLTLKDENANLSAVCWKGVAAALPFKPEDGLEVVCEGKITTYNQQSRYQLVITRMEPAGEGALMALLEERKKKLDAEGLFAEERKKALPYIPSIIGVVTSPKGAVIRDILHRLNDRFPRRVILWPVQVQGKEAAAQIAAAIEGFNKLEKTGEIPRPDLLIVGRGGGSLEDLWPFNEEIVVRAAAASEIPLISAVGHETDTTLIDHAADVRAPTPTAAAELAVPVQSELKVRTADLAQRLEGGRRRFLDGLRERIAGLARGIPSPRDILGLSSQRLDDLAARLPRGLSAFVKSQSLILARAGAGLTLAVIRSNIELNHTRFFGVARVLETLSYHATLNRGFAVVRETSGKVVTVAKGQGPGKMLDIEFKDGHLPVVTKSISGETQKKSSLKKAKTNKKNQGSLF